MLEVKVLGDPVPQGSMSIFKTKDGRAFMAHNKGTRLKKWRDLIAKEVKKHFQDPPTKNAVRAELTFILRRPGSVPITRREFPIVAPDCDKLVRSVFDALTGVVYEDDKQVVEFTARKVYDDSEPAGLRLRIW